MKKYMNLKIVMDYLMEQKLNNEKILYLLDTNPQSIVFYNLNKKEKIITLNNLELISGWLCRIIKLNENEVAIAGNGKVYLIDY